MPLGAQKGSDGKDKLREYDEMKRRDQGLPEECFETFTAEMSGLDEAALAALPPDAPSGSPAAKAG